MTVVYRVDPKPGRYRVQIWGPNAKSWIPVEDYFTSFRKAKKLADRYASKGYLARVLEVDEWWTETQ